MTRTHLLRAGKRSGMYDNRVIARYEGTEEGPLLIAIGAIHGNEKAGVKAIDLLTKMLEVEPITNPDFFYRGNFVGIIGNLKATEKHQRYIDRDLNRMWTENDVDIALGRNTDISKRLEEHDELRDVLQRITDEILHYKPKRVVLLDLHTTSSDGGVFSIPSADPESVIIAEGLNAPVIEGIIEDIKGTTLHYFVNREVYGCPIISVTFEGGQHEDPLSVNRCIAAIIGCMRSIGAVSRADVESIHDQLMTDSSSHLPLRCKLLYKHSITPEDHFAMLPGFSNFQKIEKWQHIANDRNGPIFSKFSGRILMPLYQDKGEDGFFVIEDLESKVNP